ncbi:MAG: gephyrin-like molybdotransferase Glp [Methanoregulaceae archaeon]
MSRFLQLVPVREAIETIVALAPEPGQEVVPLESARGRVLAADVRTNEDIPGFDRSIVDGYAVLAADTIGAGESLPAMLRFSGRVAMGQSDTPPHIDPGSCIYVPTGGFLPPGADAVVMVENTESAGDMVLVRKTVAPQENVLRFNEDFAKNEVVLKKGHPLSPQDLGVLAATGTTGVPVTIQPLIGILSTGNELVPATQKPTLGQVRDVNSPMIAAFVQEIGCTPKIYGIIRDERSSLESAMSRAAAECDAVLISGGSSKDDRDMTVQVIAGLGEVRIHGIALAPGKPTIIGRIGKAPVLGLPGHPGAVFVVMSVIGKALIGKMTGLDISRPKTTRATLSVNIPSQRGREEYIRVHLENGTAYPLFGKSGLLNTLVRSDGMIRIPDLCEGLEQGSDVEVLLW